MTIEELETQGLRLRVESLLARLGAIANGATGYSDRDSDLAQWAHNAIVSDDVLRVHWDGVLGRATPQEGRTDGK